MGGFVHRGFESLPLRIAFSAPVAIAAVLTAALLAGCGNSARPAGRPNAVARQPSVVLSEPPPAAPAALAARIDLAQRVIDDRSSPSGLVAQAGRLEQLATLELQRQTAQARRATLAALGGQASGTMRACVDASAALSGLGRAQSRLPHWRIVRAAAPGTLLGYFREAQARLGVPWEDLAAIELIETDFGRVEGLSSAGAQGPMQFLPASWARYGSGQVGNQQDAILAAARLLRANGAPGDMALALYHYNNSTRYVQAVEDYARRMGADPRSYYGYYYWQVVYDRAGGPVILPVGYPEARAQPVGIGP